MSNKPLLAMITITLLAAGAPAQRHSSGGYQRGNSNGYGAASQGSASPSGLSTTLSRPGNNGAGAAGGYGHSVPASGYSAAPLPAGMSRTGSANGAARVSAAGSHGAGAQGSSAANGPTHGMGGGNPSAMGSTGTSPRVMGRANGHGAPAPSGVPAGQTNTASQRGALFGHGNGLQAFGRGTKTGNGMFGSSSGAQTSTGNQRQAVVHKKPR